MGRTNPSCLKSIQIVILLQKRGNIMAEYQNELGQVLDPLIDELVEDLQANGWTAKKNAIQGVPYIRIRRTGFFHTISFSNWFNLFGYEKFPDATILPSGKYWCWEALVDKWNPNTTGYKHYSDKQYSRQLRGVIRGLGTAYSFQDMQAAIYIMLWDPCKIRNSFAHIKYLDSDPDPQSVCPVCNPPIEFKKEYPDGNFPSDFIEGFIPMTEAQKDNSTLMLFAGDPGSFELVEPIELNGLKDRFEAERAIREHGEH